MRKRMKRARPSHTTVVAYLTLFLVLSGGAAYAASHLGKNSVGTKQLKKNAVTTAKIKKEAVTAAKVKKGTLTGTQINASTLGTVPTASQANALAPQEAWHVVGAPGEPGFEHSFTDYPLARLPPASVAAFFRRGRRIVHLKGGVLGGEAWQIRLPAPPGLPARKRNVPRLSGLMRRLRRVWILARRHLRLQHRCRW